MREYRAHQLSNLMTIKAWQPIQQVTQQEADFGDPLLPEIAERWSSMKDEPFATDFLARLSLEWSIETGMLERLYDWDRGTTELMLEQGVTVDLIPPGQPLPPDQIRDIIQDHRLVIDWLFDFVKSDRHLSTSYVKQLNQLVLRHQPKTYGKDDCGNRREVDVKAGEYKTGPNNPSRPDGSVVLYCPPDHAAQEMDNLIHYFHEQDSPQFLTKVPADVRAAWLHHRFTQIHPFNDGNGRVARALASLVLIKAGYFPLTITAVKRNRNRYLDALETADRGFLLPLTKLIGYFQSRHLFQAVDYRSKSHPSPQPQSIEEAAKRAAEAIHASEVGTPWRHATPENLTQQALVEADSALHRLETALLAVGGALGLQFSRVRHVAPPPRAILEGLSFEPFEILKPSTSSLATSEPIRFSVNVIVVSVGSPDHGILACIPYGGDEDHPVAFGDPILLFGETEWRMQLPFLKTKLEAALIEAIGAWKNAMIHNKTGSPFEPPASS